MKPHNTIGLCALLAAGITLYSTTGWHLLHIALIAMAVLTIAIDRKAAK